MCISLCRKPAMVSVRMGILLAFMVTLQIILSKADPCCKTLMLQSSGSLAEGDQKHLLGLYYQDDSKDGEDGTMVYRQVIVLLSLIENQWIWKNAKILVSARKWWRRPGGFLVLQSWRLAWHVVLEQRFWRCTGLRVDWRRWTEMSRVASTPMEMASSFKVSFLRGRKKFNLKFGKLTFVVY